MKYLLIIALIFGSSTLFSQSYIDSIVYNGPSEVANLVLSHSMDLDEMSEVSYDLSEDRTINFNIKMFKKDKLMLEFFRYSDTVFYCLEYDDEGEIISKGLLAPSKNRFYNSEDYFINDKGEEEVRIIEKFPFVSKVGTWEEKDQNGITWVGRYENEKRIGKWKALNPKTNFPKVDKIRDYSYLPLKDSIVNVLMDSSIVRVTENLLGEWYKRPFFMCLRIRSV